MMLKMKMKNQLRKVKLNNNSNVFVFRLFDLFIDI